MARRKAYESNVPEIVDLLDTLSRQMSGTVVRAGAQAASQVFYDAVKANASAFPKKSGRLAESIYQKFSPENSGHGRARYHISWRLTGAPDAPNRAPHAHLLEFGHWRYFKVVRIKGGEYRTAVRPGMEGVKAPKGRATIAEKSKYYQTLPAPKWVPARPFLTPAYYAVKDKAADAAVEVVFKAFEDALA